MTAAFTSETKAILLNTPHNPTGKVFTRSELEFVADLCRRHDVAAITDEVYERIVYDDVEHISLATLPDMWERTLILNSTGKTFSMTGWKIGFAVGSPGLNAALRAVHQFVTFASATPFQDAMAHAMEIADQRDYYEQLKAEYSTRRRALKGELEGAGLKTLPVSGSYFLVADISELGFESDVDFCRFLTSDVGVAAVPPSAFYVDPNTAPLLARFCFAKREETILEAGRRLKSLDRSLEQRKLAASSA